MNPRWPLICSMERAIEGLKNQTIIAMGAIVNLKNKGWKAGIGRSERSKRRI